MLRVGLAAALLVGAVSAAKLSLPSPMVACSCMAPQHGAPALTGHEGDVLVGTVGPRATPGASPEAGPAVEQPDLGLVAIALVTFVVGLTAAAAILSFGRRRDPPPTDKP